MAPKPKEKNQDQDKSNQEKNQNESLREKFMIRAKEAINTEILPTLSAMGRQGASEMGQALKAFNDSIGPQDTTGTIGSPTQQQISADFGLYGKSGKSADNTKADTIHGPVMEDPDLER